MTQEPWEIRRYIDERGVRPFEEWFLVLDKQAQSRVIDRLDRLAAGNFGDFKPVGRGVYELRLFFGAGYRIYYALLDGQVVLLLAGGSKKSQSKDIKKAQKYWKSYRSK